MNIKNKMIVTLLSILITSTAIGQISTEQDEKAIVKCWKVFNTKSHTKGIAKLEKHMNKQSWPSATAYESLVQMEYINYSQNENAFEITSDGEVNDSLTLTFHEIMAEMYKMRFINICRRSTTEATSPSADMYLRRMMIDVDPDTAISEKGKAYFDEAESFFEGSDFELAAMNYRKAIETDSGYYKAIMYLGDSFWAREEPDSALFYYSLARDMQPNLLEARIYVIDALTEMGLFYRAKKECIDALTVYPGYNLKYKFQRILTIENKEFVEHRVLRSFYANKIDDDEQAKMSLGSVWLDYRAAKEDVKLYCNEDGIIEENGDIEDRYLEVYSYRVMLENHPNDLPPLLHFADKMREEGYLEPYIFISLFHYDIYPQFKDYMSVEENREKAKEFVEKYLIKPAKK